MDDMEKYDKVLKEVENELDLIDAKLKKYYLDYFYFHRNRYLSDLEIIENYAKKIGGEILEIGCVPCHLTYCLKKLGYHVISLDLNPDRVRDFIEEHNLNVIKCNIEVEKIPFEDGRFSLVIFNEVFEHLRIDPISTLKEINRVLRPGGIMILTTPNLYSLGKIIVFLLGRSFNDAYEEFEKLHTIGHMGHIREYSTKEVKKFLENTGFIPKKVMYKFYNKTRFPILNLLYRLIPKWRPFQVIISEKAV